MSRSKHTAPPRIRAAARVRDPYAPCSRGDRSRQRVYAHLLKEQGLIAESVADADETERPIRWPRLHARRPRHGHLHAAGVADVRRLLSFVDAYCFYGLREIELAQGDDPVPGASLRLGRLIVPGRIVLYDHMPSPWLLQGRLAPRESERLRRAGALVRPIGAGYQTVVEWPETTLRDFILFDVLMHEVGHHIVQQYTGKYPARVMRTRDHEAFADRFAARCRREYDDWPRLR